MNASATADHDLWHRLAAAAATELAALPSGERTRLTAELAAIAGWQDELYRLFLRGDGAAACAACNDSCCSCGKYHLTLVNLLAYLDAGEPFPPPDFSCTCPMLGVAGCRLPPQRRPYTCITFICGTVEDRLSDAERQRFYAVEGKLRALYEGLDRRFAGSSLRGLLNRGERLGTGPLLAPALSRHPCARHFIREE
ncbi:MAG: hypothetical protein A2091_12345 [Desulfuromonadales bacterium GWD2_61_12]|nr:MAG: hypothetical protein A2005_10375 [Desulfuromonadales bacterium GWC2_61_20]OGR35852.1 MAG: hypothetical protein A2091_12345 [Desulfuromonadales bacterium GWD2_61_12]